MAKGMAWKLRRLWEIPGPGGAINCIKDRIAGMRWRIQARQGLSLDAIPDGAERAHILTETFNAPNPDDSFRSFAEQVGADIIVSGSRALQGHASGHTRHPSVVAPRPCAPPPLHLP